MSFWERREVDALAIPVLFLLAINVFALLFFSIILLAGISILAYVLFGDYWVRKFNATYGEVVVFAFIFGCLSFVINALSLNIIFILEQITMDLLSLFYVFIGSVSGVLLFSLVGAFLRNKLNEEEKN